MYSPLTRGALFIIVSELMFATMGALVKTASADLPNEMLVFMRNVFGIVVLGPWLWRGGLQGMKTEAFPLLLLRSMLGLGAMYCFFYALAHLQLADGMLLKMTAPIFVPFVALFMLGEGLSLRVLLAMPVGFAGVLLVLQPQGDFNSAALIGLLGGLMAASAKVSVRRLSRTEPALRIVFYFAVLGALVSAVPLLWAWRTPGATQWLLLAAMGVVGSAGQILLTRGYAAAAAGEVAPFTYFSVLFGAAYGYIFWGEIPGLHFATGAAFIALAGVLILRARRAVAVAAPVAD